MPFAIRLIVATILCGLAILNASVAQDIPTHIRGTITSTEGTTLAIAEAGGEKAVIRLAPNAKIMVAANAKLSDATTNSYVGIANTGPNGLQDAIEVHIFPDAMRGASDGERPWDLGKRSRMTNGTIVGKVDAYEGKDLTLSFKSGETTIHVSPNATVVRLEIGSSADLKTGATVFVRDGERQPDESVLTESIIVGRGSVKPPL